MHTAYVCMLQKHTDQCNETLTLCSIHVTFQVPCKLSFLNTQQKDITTRPILGSEVKHSTSALQAVYPSFLFVCTAIIGRHLLAGGTSVISWLGRPSRPYIS
ncbi:TPA: hypothetical protein ACH3X1_011144 [Trebouxia sp. C0004]